MTDAPQNSRFSEYLDATDPLHRRVTEVCKAAASVDELSPEAEARILATLRAAPKHAGVFQYRSWVFAVAAMAALSAFGVLWRKSQQHTDALQFLTAEPAPPQKHNEAPEQNPSHSKDSPLPAPRQNEALPAPEHLAPSPHSNTETSDRTDGEVTDVYAMEPELGEQTLTLRQHFIKPELLSNLQRSIIRPILPKELDKEGAIYNIPCQVCISEKGTVTSVSVLESLHPKVDPQVVRSIKSWKFRPATLEGQPVTACMRLHYQLKASSPHKLVRKAQPHGSLVQGSGVTYKFQNLLSTSSIR